MARKEIGTSWDRESRNALNDNFKELFDQYIRSGKELEEAKTLAATAVADSILAKDVAEQTRKELINIIRQQTSGGDLVPEIVQARGDKPTLGARMDDVTAQLAQIVTVIKPTGTANDSPNINSILNAGNSKFLIKKGTYNIDEDIIVKSNSVIEWEEGASFKKTATNAAGYNIVFLQNVENVTLINPNIMGDRDIHTGTDGEWGHGIVVRGSKNVKIKNPIVTKCWGDGIVVSYSPTLHYSENVYVNNALCDNNRRNGFTIGSVKNLYVNDSQFNNSIGTDPQAGIDLEPDSENGVLENINFKNIMLKNNGKRGMFFCLWLIVGDQNSSPKKDISIVLDNVVVEGGNFGFETLMSNFTDTAVPGATRTAIKNLRGKIVLNNCETKNTKQNGVRLYRWYEVGLRMVFNNLKIINPNTEKLTGVSNNAIVLYDPNDSGTPAEYALGGVELNNIEILHATDDPLKQSIFVNDPTNQNPAKNFVIRNPKKIDGKILFSQGLDTTCKILDESKSLKLLIADTQRPIDKYEPYYSIVSNKNTTADKTLFINAPNMHYEEITFVNENAFTFTIECNSTQKFFPYNTKQCVLTGHGSKVTVKRIDDLKWEVVNQVNASFV